MAQAPARCSNLEVLRYDWDQNPYNGAVTLMEYIRNNDPSRLISATFAFEFLADQDVKLEEKAHRSRIWRGSTYKVPVYTSLREFKTIVPRPLNCSFER